MINRKYVFLLILMILCNSNVFALKSDSSKPVQIDADHATLDEKQKQTVFDGNVIITRGSLVVHASKGTANQDIAGDREINLFGSPVIFQQLTDDGKQVIGQCNHFNYDTKTGLAVLTDRARVRKGRSIIIGDKLTYNTKTEVYSAISDLGNGITQKSIGRVTVILDQNDMSAPKAAESVESQPHVKQAGSTKH